MSLREIQTRITDATARAGRAPGSVTLIAVSKQQTAARITQVLEEGQRVFGENRVQEASGRWPELRERFEGIDLHLIGPLQSNKLKAAMSLFDAIHSLDRDKLARMLAGEVQALGRCPEIFVQVNTGAEPQKAGVLPEALDDFLRLCRQSYGLTLAGLMAIPPADEDPEPHFAMLAGMAARNGLPGLSMGMSGDFELAIARGATHVRVGSAIFGERAISG